MYSIKHLQYQHYTSFFLGTWKINLEINLTEFQSFGRIVLAHFAEGYGEHYVGLDQEWQESQNGSSRSWSNKEVETNVDFNFSKSNDHDSNTSPSMTEHNDDCNVGTEIFPVTKSMSRMMKKR